MGPNSPASLTALQKGNRMYRRFGLLLPESDFSLEAAARRLKMKFPNFEVQQGDNSILLHRDTWEIHLVVEAGPEVLEESRRISEHISGAEDELGISRCARRVVVSSDMADPEMEHFDDVLKVTEVLQTFKGLIAVDPQEPSLL